MYSCSKPFVTSYLPVPHSSLTSGQADLVKDEWVAILKLSTLWSSRGLRKLAIYHLELQVDDPIEKILLGRAFYAPHWLLNGYASLVTRLEPITEQESISIGFLMAVRLYIIRHELTGHCRRITFSGDMYHVNEDKEYGTERYI